MARICIRLWQEPVVTQRRWYSRIPPEMFMRCIAPLYTYTVDCKSVHGCLHIRECHCINTGVWSLPNECSASPNSECRLYLHSPSQDPQSAHKSLTADMACNMREGGAVGRSPCSCSCVYTLEYMQRLIHIHTYVVCEEYGLRGWDISHICRGLHLYSPAQANDAQDCAQRMQTAGIGGFAVFALGATRCSL